MPSCLVAQDRAELGARDVDAVDRDVGERGRDGGDFLGYVERVARVGDDELVDQSGVAQQLRRRRRASGTTADHAARRPTRASACAHESIPLFPSAPIDDDGLALAEHKRATCAGAPATSSTASATFSSMSLGKLGPQAAFEENRSAANPHASGRDVDARHLFDVAAA